jgi:hypothetical protein
VPRTFVDFAKEPVIKWKYPLIILLDICPEYYSKREGVIAAISSIRSNSTVMAIALAHLPDMRVSPDTSNQKMARKHGLDGALPLNAHKDILLERFLDLHAQMSQEEQEGYRISEWHIVAAANNSSLWYRALQAA